ncbi:hypothetical protein RI054_16g77260 [Pseudoscourfieldia marina]
MALSPTTPILPLISTAGDGYVHDEAFDAAVEAACSSTVVSTMCTASIEILRHVLEDDERNSPRMRFEEKHGRARYGGTCTSGRSRRFTRMRSIRKLVKTKQCTSTSSERPTVFLQASSTKLSQKR